jgi:hypothetical protein
MRSGGICTAKSDQTCDNIACEDDREDMRRDGGLCGYGGGVEVAEAGFQAGRDCGG